jgi:hypothetical protein
MFGSSGMGPDHPALSRDYQALTKFQVRIIRANAGSSGLG